MRLMIANADAGAGAGDGNSSNEAGGCEDEHHQVLPTDCWNRTRMYVRTYVCICIGICLETCQYRNRTVASKHIY